MCGIVGYVGHSNAQQVIISGLEKLEYRGYDSAGIAVIGKNGMESAKFKGSQCWTIILKIIRWKET